MSNESASRGPNMAHNSVQTHPPTSKRQIEPSPAVIAVYYEQRRIGHVLQRGCESFEAFDHDEKSIGIFGSEDEAASAIWKTAR